MIQFPEPRIPPRSVSNLRPQLDMDSPLGKISRLLPVAVLLVLTLAACARITNPEGWSGGAIADDMLLIGTREGNLLALDREDGHSVWKFELHGTERERAIYSTPAVFGSTIYFGGYDGNFYALDLDNGDILWQTSIGGPVVGSPAIADGKVLFGSSDGNLYAYSLDDDTEIWKFSTGGKVWSEPAVMNGIVYFGSLDKTVYAVRLQDGEEVWRYETGGAVASSPVIARNRVMIGSFDSNFYALHAQTGEEVWRFDDAQSWYWARPVIIGDTIYVPSLDSNLYSLDIDTGALLWTLETKAPIIGSPAVALDMLAVPLRDAESRTWQIALIEPSEGAKMGVCAIGEEIRTPLSAEDDIIYFGARDHSIRAVRVKENGNPDEEWVHFTNKDDPLPRGRVPSC